MRPEEWERCVEIFSAALARQSEERAAFIDCACAGDESLRREVTLLLQSHEESGDFISAPVFVSAPELLTNDDPDALIGTQMGPYRIESVLGSGGMGVVYRARDERLGRKVGLKLLPQSLAANMTHLARLKREARTASALNHPNIVTIHEIGEADSTAYIASELIEGETLRQRLMRGRMQLSETVDVAIQVADALSAAHEAGIVHRDVKPENIMLRPDGYVKVLDFGIAKLAESAFAEPPSVGAVTYGEPGATPNGTESMALAETSLGLVLGTVRYMSPEQACPDAVGVDKRTDIWSLGVVLHEMVTGHTPFTGETPQEVMSAILEKEPPALTTHLANAPAELQQIISTTLRKDREQRYRSARELFQALKELRRKLEAELERAAAPLWLRWARPPAAVALVLLAAAVALALPMYWHRNVVTATSPPEKSIAVLPLQNLSEGKEDAFFAEGVQNELLSNLAKIKDLKVISRTSVMQYKGGAERNLKEIAQQLRVNNVVEGSIRRSGDRVRVSVQLIDAQTDRHLWGENYDRTVADSLSLQGELATEIAAAVGATLTPQEKARVHARPTNNPAAYDVYLRARAIPVGWGVYAEGDVTGAIRLYQEAVKLDPNFTLAWAYLSMAHMQSAWIRTDSSPARLASAKDALGRALALDPNLPEVHLARGYYFANEDDSSRALAEFRQAEKDLPNSADVIEAIARAHRALGHWEEAVANLQRAIELDPRNVRASNNLALTYCAMRRFPEALSTLDRVLAWDPTNARALLTKADALVGMGDLQSAEPLLENPEVPPTRRGHYALYRRNYAAAIDILSRALATGTNRDRTDPNNIIILGLSQKLAGDVSAARATYKKAIENFRRELEQVAPGSYFEADTHASLGEAYAGLGDAASAIAEGEKAMALVPTSKHAELGANLEHQMANIYAQLGDADHAIPMLQRLLRTSYGGAMFLTPATLRLDPIWNPIRNDRRFQELAWSPPPY